jgi:hypothetical protein
MGGDHSGDFLFLFAACVHARQCLVLFSVRRELVAALLSLIVLIVCVVDESAAHFGEPANHRTGPWQVGEKDSRC